MSGTPSQPVRLDREALLERVGYDPEILKEIAALFLETAPSQLEEVKLAVALRDAEKLNRTAHSLKGAVGNFTDATPYQLAYELEKMGKRGELDRAPETVASLEEELRRLSAALQELA